MEQKKKRGVVEWAMHNRSIVILITACLMAFGVYALAKINKNEFPDITIRQGIVAAVYPGASPEDVEIQVTKPLEDYIFSYKEVNKAKTKSYSRNGMTIVQVELNSDIDDMQVFWNKFRHGVQSFKTTGLPKGVLAVSVIDDFGSTSALLITMESEEKTYRELDGYMRQLKDRLRQVESIGRLNVMGDQQEQISVRVDAERLRHYGVNNGVVAARLLANGFQTTAGSQKGSDLESPIYVGHTVNALHDVEQMVVMSDPRGNVVRLKDIATVRREYPQDAAYVTNNGRRCLVLSVELKQGRSTTEMGEEVSQVLDEFQASLPDDVSLFKITNQPKVVSDSVWEFLLELLIAIGAVIAVVLLLMPMRVALVASSTIPITIFISLGLFHALGLELNTVTLASLIITLGMIVDNSIVIIDSYMELLAEGKSRWQASIESATHFFKSILSATLAISVTFFPFLLTLSGSAYDFVHDFPFGMSLVLLVSLAVAMLVVPFLQFFFIRKPIATEKQKFSFLDLLQRWYDRVIDRCFRHPYVTLAVGLVCIALGAWQMTLMPQKFMPFADRDQFAVEIYLPTGTPLQRTAEVADSLEQLLRQDARVVDIASFKGCASPRFHNSYAPQIAGSNYAQFIVNTTGIKATQQLMNEFRPRYTEALPEAYVKFKQLAYGLSANDVEVRLTGSDWTALCETADSLTAFMRQRPELLMVRSDLREPLAAIGVDLKREQADRLGISTLDLEAGIAALRNSDGLTLATLWDGDDETPVKLMATAQRPLEDEPVAVYGGLSSVPLRQVASVGYQWHPGQLPHRGGMPTITVSADVESGVNVIAATTDLRRQLSSFALPEGVSLSWGGNIEESEEYTPQVIMALAIAVAIIFFLLLAHFRRINTALLVIFSLLLCLPGTALGVIINGVDFGFTCYLGIVSLLGILVRNVIIMYDYAEELRTLEGLTSRDAIYTSAKRRMRPIFLTSAAASMGVIPMLLGGSSLWMPMAAIICFGTLITMLFILTIMPVAYWKMMEGSTRRRARSEAMERM